ncbi:uncharacterized protein BT62DRAFT_128758 [Guyanagaster necrorhizus]|uniref:Uncharacterized protein n=1 Tax=Guyanagaster necrorhizus TaxID=856835 RepID=A0A9P8AU69_9AGAR|nr:uncharacterized protein BT62DRAFT_128758 [Guyanagaster necrorhizus MCA 3950]KAG7446602.1 hypothetical protein BT62DRAFT_128758 [Guyanagaster necrorhizus MCA 3950]
MITWISTSTVNCTRVQHGYTKSICPYTRFRKNRPTFERKRHPSLDLLPRETRVSGSELARVFELRLHFMNPQWDKWVKNTVARDAHSLLGFPPQCECEFGKMLLRSAASVAQPLPLKSYEGRPVFGTIEITLAVLVYRWRCFHLVSCHSI